MPSGDGSSQLAEGSSLGFVASPRALVHTRPDDVENRERRWILPLGPGENSFLCLAQEEGVPGIGPVENEVAQSRGGCTSTAAGPEGSRRDFLYGLMSLSEEATGGNDPVDESETECFGCCDGTTAQQEIQGRTESYQAGETLSTSRAG